MVVEERVGGRPTLVVAVLTSPERVSEVWPGLLDEVWALLRSAGVVSGCRNVMLYRDTVAGLHIEVGVLAPGGVLPSGRVVASGLPAGPVATTVHRGPYTGLGAAHRALGTWCRAAGRQPAGSRWEVYGPHRDDPARLSVEVSWLLADVPG
ncbi:GyrI-like domain-containing protein [Pseudonocardia benzenivorans]|uniref:GyrI-like domain-containing protein n=1 Tax=Pseudonocardia benzenivorans TaxID=228005 RepID=A0ABW3VJE6_9PSEU